METVGVLLKWLEQQPKGRSVVIDEGGLALQILNHDDEPTGDYYELGGIPDKILEQERHIERRKAFLRTFVVEQIDAVARYPLAYDLGEEILDKAVEGDPEARESIEQKLRS